MTNKVIVESSNIHIEDILDSIGDYQIPKFKTEFTWSSNKIIKLFDSLLKGYPIGSLLFWQVSSGKGLYILDGFHRVYTLLNVLTKEPQGNKFLIYFHIKENRFTASSSIVDAEFLIPLYKIYNNRELFKVLRELDKYELTEVEKTNCIENARNLHDALHKYRVPFVEIKGGDKDSIIEILTRLGCANGVGDSNFLLF